MKITCDYCQCSVETKITRCSECGERLPTLIEMAGGNEASLAIVFTDIKGSTRLIDNKGFSGWLPILEAHFKQARSLMEREFRHDGYEVKTIGDAFMFAFKEVTAAVDFAAKLHREPGHKEIKIRVGIHYGLVAVYEDDIFGNGVNFAARVVSSTKDDLILLSKPAMEKFNKDFKSRNGLIGRPPWKFQSFTVPINNRRHTLYYMVSPD